MEEVELGVTINPVAFLVINKDTIKLMPIDHSSTLDRIADYVPDIINKFCDKKEEEKEDENIENGEIFKNTETAIPKMEKSDYLEDE